MATVDLAVLDGDGAPSHWANVKTPYLVEVVLDFAEAATEKGSALAQADVIEIIDVPEETLVLMAGFEVTEAMTGTSTDATLDFGITGGDVDKYVDGFDLDAASVGDYATVATGANVINDALFTSDDTLDILIVTQTGTITGGKLRCWAYMVDVSGGNQPGIAAPKS